ncbi:MAG: CRISPR-associated helicase Cas3' [Synergistaceae bacterium]|nr:CRISPR-associated helicase Cas3' [Synergistaceae bacterium]
MFSHTLERAAAKSCVTDSSKWLPFVIHSQDTAGIIRKFFSDWLPEQIRNELAKGLQEQNNIEKLYERSENLCYLVALLHDIGKLTLAFQSKIAPKIENQIEFFQSIGIEISKPAEFRSSPHQIAGHAILEDYKFPQEIAVIVGSHHGKGASENEVNFQFNTFPRNYFGRGQTQEKFWRSLWEEWISYSLSKSGFTVETLPKPNVKSQMLITGLLIMADWIASNTYYFPYIDVGETLNESDLEDRVNSAWKKLSFPEILYINSYCNAAEIFNDRFGFEPNSVQREVIDIVSRNPFHGLYILEAPMGLGKTEAALSAAEILIERKGAGGIYFGLPTQATANGIFGRIRDWASKCDPQLHSIRLAHGMTELNKEYRALLKKKAEDSGDENVIIHEWFEGRKQALLADFVIATIDQFLLASLQQKHVMMRHLGLAGKVVILDECHAYDAYMNVYLDRTLAWMGAYNVPVIVLSATLPPERRNEMVKAYLNRPVLPEIKGDVEPYAYPIMTYTCGNDVIQKALTCDIPEKKISVEYLEENALSSYLSSKLKDGGCGAVIVNSVPYSQELARALELEMPDFKIICFNGRFIATDRAKIEEDILSKAGKKSNADTRSKLIVVGTQVIEQSLDLDFDVMVTELCPMDLLLQRSGRLHRHNRNRPLECQRPVLAVLEPSEPRTSVYSKWILEQTRKYLPEELVIPSCIPELVSKVYAKPSEDSETYAEYEKQIDDKKYKAEKYCIKSNMLNSRRRYNLLTHFFTGEAGNSAEAEASVRDTDETIEVLVLKRKSDTEYSLVSGKYDFDITSALSEDEALNIARERLRLSPIFCQGGNFAKTLEELELNMPKMWENLKFLKGETLLVLDHDNEAELIGKKLRYSNKFGLEVKHGAFV